MARQSVSSDPAPLGSAEGYLAALGLVALMTLLGALLSARGNLADIGLLYLVPVMFAATRHGLVTGIATGLVSSLAYNFFFIPPVLTFAIRDPSHAITVLVLLGVAVVASQMAARVRQQARAAQDEAGREAALAGFARVLMGVTRRDELWSVLAGELARRFDVRVVVCEAGPDGAAQLAASAPQVEQLDLLELVSAQWSLDNALAAGPGAATPTASEWLFHPVVEGTRAVATVGLARPDATAPLRAERLPLLASLIDQASLAHARIALEDEMVALGRVQERDALRGALLSSLGHDLRTPLTTLLGSLRALEAGQAGASLAVARGAAERLDRFISNLLDMVRIESGTVEGTREAVDLGEAVAAALDDLRGGAGAARVAVAVPDDLPLVLADARLLHHCLINLIDNALRHGSEGGVTVEALAGGDGAVELAVLDRGPGLPPGSETRVFGQFERLEGSDRVGGTGLGLAIVRGFAEAMGVQALAANRADGPGARFVLRFPPALLRRVEAAE
ncbi:DUF4118 domain-containing protein [Novosphingobium olei]|uniref:histidine kinase n=1 Tax=Novosphingobium olei TaxID=2728851 RepID=A0A7Y0G9S9_9SPHN|nr:DUF4118 domain-containing protein [Novosphingobium olei]NML93159.1 DUF4118 domain-containing protein [Novosphingobium olei]